MSADATQQWKYALGRMLKKLAYVGGAAALVAALIVSRMVKAEVSPLVADDLVRVVPFAASFLVYLVVMAAGAATCHFGIWRLGNHLTLQPQEPTVCQPQTRTVRLTQSTPVP